MLTVAFMLVFGVLVGIFGSIMGLGGGILVVPIFLLLFDIPLAQTVGTSLVVVFFNSLSGTIAYARQKRIVYPITWRFGLATVPGAFIGGYLIDYFSLSLFSVIFGLLLLFTAYTMYQKARNIKKASDDGNLTFYQTKQKLGMLVSLFVGMLSSILGVGGGTIHVPFMNQVMKVPIHWAVATSTSILFISAVAGLITHGSLGHILWTEAICTGIGATIGATIGAGIAKRLPAKKLMLIFAAFVLVMGIKFLLQAIF